MYRWQTARQTDRQWSLSKVFILPFVYGTLKIQQMFWVIYSQHIGMVEHFTYLKIVVFYPTAKEGGLSFSSSCVYVRMYFYCYGSPCSGINRFIIVVRLTLRHHNKKSKIKKNPELNKWQTWTQAGSFLTILLIYC